MRKRFKIEGAVSAKHLVVVIAVAAIAGTLVATPHGIGLSPDSLAYVVGAQSILAGEGFSKPPGHEPIIHLAPFYPFLLAVIGFFGLEPVLGARMLAAGLFGLNLLLVFRLVGLIEPNSGSTAAWVGVGITALALSARPLWEIHLMAWTEPLFICLSLAGLWALAVYVRTKAWWWLWSAGCLIAISVMTRYAGLSMWVASCLILLVMQGRETSRRLLDTMLFSALSLAPIAVWAVRNWLAGGSPTNRSFAIHPIGTAQLHQGLATAASWVMVSDMASGWVKLASIIAVLAVLALGVFLYFRQSGPDVLRSFGPMAPVIVKVMSLTGIVYLLFLILSISFADANTPLDQRILSPLFMFLLVPAAFGVFSWIRYSRGRLFVRLIISVLFLLSCSSYLRSSSDLLVQSLRDGMGFNSVRWKNSELISEFRKLEVGGVVYSNSPDALYFLSGRAAKRLPTAFSKVTRDTNSEFQDELTSLRQELDNGGVLVAFGAGDGPAAKSTSEMVDLLGLVARNQYSDGTIYVR